MATEINVQGASDLRKLGDRLERAGRAGLARDLDAAIVRAVAPLRAALPASAMATLPRAGGLGARTAATHWRVIRRSGPRFARVRLQGQGDVNLRRLDQGFVRHPVFGHAGRWVGQKVPPGWFTRPAEAARPAVHAAVTAAIAEIAAKLGGPL